MPKVLGSVFVFFCRTGGSLCSFNNSVLAKDGSAMLARAMPHIRLPSLVLGLSVC